MALDIHATLRSRLPDVICHGRHQHLLSRPIYQWFTVPADRGVPASSVGNAEAAGDDEVGVVGMMVMIGQACTAVRILVSSGQ